jgi:uncharacterized protein YprB with RNaseH-like and TPR domain
MLERSFVHLPGIGLSTEKRLWQRGILDWNALRDGAASLFVGSRLNGVREALDATRAAWERRDLLYFYENLPRAELWRLVPGFFDEIAFLDIETDGLNLPPSSSSTTITFYFRGVVHQAHQPAEKAALLARMSDEAAIFCTYFGEVFDLPFLRREFKMDLRKPHLDLCFWLKRLGYNGGLKKVERAFDDIPRRQSVDIGGLDAVRLWHLHQRGVRGALETLLTYNAEDTVVLESLLVKAYNMELEQRPHLDLQPLELRPLPRLATEVDLRIYERLRTPG